jgi:large repetitive protein
VQSKPKILKSRHIIKTIIKLKQILLKTKTTVIATMLAFALLLTINETIVAACGIVAHTTTTIGANGLVTFTNASTGTSFTTLYQYSFGDGTPNASTASATHTYAANGIYTVVFGAGDVITNCFDTDTLIINITNVATPCSIAAMFSTSNSGNGLVGFTSTSTGISPSTSYQWSFGDGASGFGAATNHVYTANGSYSVILFIEDSLTQCVDVDTVIVNVINIMPACNVVAQFAVVQGVNGSFAFNNTSTGSVSSSTLYQYNFGDGSTASNDTATHTYSTNGMYNLVFTVFDPINQCSDSDTLMLNVTNVDTTSFCATITNMVMANGGAMFTATPVAGVNSIDVWYFGDGGSDTGSVATHTYTANGNYAVQLVRTTYVVNGNGIDTLYCLTQDTIVINNVVPNAIITINNSSLTNVYPNPNNGTFTIVAPLAGNYIIINELGQTIKTIVTTVSNTNVAVSNLNNGTYFLVDKNSNTISRQKIIVAQ